MNSSNEGTSPAPLAVSDSRPASTQRLGLTSAEAAARLQRDGPNVLPRPERRRRLAITVSVLREPMLLLLLLLAATAVYVLLGEPREAMLLGASVLLVIGLMIYQEQKSEHALQTLRDLSSPRARVMRDGEASMLAAPELAGSTRSWQD
ncbi:MAG: hypothetical protein LH470_00675 [Lysobacter sp.]|nr:hypothetical protein [Lysobacter sp.]